MKRQAKVLAVLFMMLVVFVGQSSAQEMGRYIVTIQGPAEQAVLRAGGIVDHVFDLIPAIAIRIPEAALPGLARNPLVVDIEEDFEMEALDKPDGPPGQDKKPPKDDEEPPPPPPQDLPWGVDRIDAEWAWLNEGPTGDGVNVAVLDTGIDYEHPDLYANCKGGINIINPRKSYKDDNGHGTHCAGIIAAEDNEEGVVGVAPEASLYGVKVLDRRGSGWVSDIIAGLDWCVNNGMGIVNMSFGGGYSSNLETACNNAWDDGAGIVLVAAAGNSGGPVSYPAAYESVIAVAATDISDARPNWSSFGEGVDIAAPGVEIYSTYLGGGYGTESGTSMACPHVVGTLALNLGADIYGTADDLPPAGVDIYTGYGLVDAGEAATGTVDYGDDLPP